ncbi:hypothetical protein BEH94_01290 [Candidatus Altiarchaeales archaeon WOR_SM1_SCG]|nr:hypothetical protein BEH94_01290 [Candidatus Altiarchaeales archaeon WOR_SM1_SCG]
MKMEELGFGYNLVRRNYCKHLKIKEASHKEVYIMKWQEYEKAVGELYKQMEEIGDLKTNITIPDRVTGHPRQVDVWWEIIGKGHTIGILVDAKLRKSKIDVKDIEEVLSLAKAVGANKSIIVTSHGWTMPAQKRAQFESMDIRLFTLDEALELVVEDYWKLCPICEDDCIILNIDGFFEHEGMVFWYLGGRCRKCKSAIAWCQDCGWKETLKIGEVQNCECEHEWGNDIEGLWLKFRGSEHKLYL